MNFDVTVIIKGLLSALVSILKSLSILTIPFVIAIIVILIIIILNYINLRYVHHKKPKSKKNLLKFIYKEKKYVIEIPLFPYKKINVFRNIFILFPKQLAYDLLNQDPNAFGEFGVHIVVGEQGSGKTMTVAYLLHQWRAMYPRMRIYTNMEYQYQDGELKHWKQLLNQNNGIYGIANVIDEIKTWWNQYDNKSVPPEMLGEICQQRKQKKAIIGTVQVFSELAKSFRSQAHFIYVPRTYLGCLTVVFKTKAKWYNAEKDVFKRYCGFFVFAHTKELRESYDTFKVIEKYKDSEFSESNLFSNKEDLPTHRVEVSLSKK